MCIYMSYATREDMTTTLWTNQTGNQYTTSILLLQVKKTCKCEHCCEFDEPKEGENVEQRLREEICCNEDPNPYLKVEKKTDKVMQESINV